MQSAIHLTHVQHCVMYVLIFVIFNHSATMETNTIYNKVKQYKSYVSNSFSFSYTQHLSLKKHTFVKQMYLSQDTI